MTPLQAMIIANNMNNSLAYCQAPAEAKGCKPEKKRQKEEGETTMTNNIHNEIPEQRNYLCRELRDARSIKLDGLKATFGLKDIEPKTAAEAIDLIKTDKIIVDEKKVQYYGWLGAIRFRDPALKEDELGFAAAKVTVDKAVNDADRIIRIKTPDEGLAAVIEFESKTFH